METHQFDSLSRSISRLLSRRALTATLGMAALGGWSPTEARRKKKKKKKNRGNGGGNDGGNNGGGNGQQVVLNPFGCVDVGNFCQSGDQCCSGICTDAQCQAHDVSTCVTGQQDVVCGGTNVFCQAPNGNDGLCTTTTGNAGYCLGDRECFACSKDADCTTICGPDAACAVCTGCTATGGTACVGPVPESCFLAP